jgi:hypothetical protein
MSKQGLKIWANAALHGMGPKVNTLEISGQTWEVQYVGEIAEFANLAKAEPETVRWVFVTGKRGGMFLSREQRNGTYTHPVRL